MLGIGITIEVVVILAKQMTDKNTPHPLDPPLHKCGEGEIGGEVKQSGEKEVKALAFYDKINDG